MKWYNTLYSHCIKLAFDCFINILFYYFKVLLPFCYYITSVWIKTIWSNVLLHYLTSKIELEDNVFILSYLNQAPPQGHTAAVIETPTPYGGFHNKCQISASHLWAIGSYRVLIMQWNEDVRDGACNDMKLELWHRRYRRGGQVTGDPDSR